MRSPLATLRRLTATTLSLLLAVGLGLIGPASALADGVERGGLNFTIVSDDISKSANGSVPEVQANSSSGSGDSNADTSGGSGGGDTSGTTGDTSGSGGDTSGSGDGTTGDASGTTGDTSGSGGDTSGSGDGTTGDTSGTTGGARSSRTRCPSKRTSVAS